MFSSSALTLVGPPAYWLTLSWNTHSPVVGLKTQGLLNSPLWDGTLDHGKPAVPLYRTITPHASAGSVVLLIVWFVVGSHTGINAIHRIVQN